MMTVPGSILLKDVMLESRTELHHAAVRIEEVTRHGTFVMRVSTIEKNLNFLGARRVHPIVLR